MAGTSVASILSECHISVSQEELLANLHGGWGRNGHYSLDETPSQNLGISSQNLQNLDPNPPSSYDGDEGDSDSEASESVDGEADMAFTQEPVEWISPADSPQAVVGAEEHDGVDKEDSYVAAFESDRSQSPSQDWHGETEQPDPQTQTPNLGLSAEFLTQPALGVMDFHLTSSEDLDQQILRRQTNPEAELQVSTGSSLLLLPPIPENEVSIVEAPVLAIESCIQPFTQAVESQPLELLHNTQEPANRMQLLEGRNEVVHDHTPLGIEGSITDEPQSVQQGHEQDELVREVLAVIDNDGRIGEQTPEEVDEESSDLQLPNDDRRHLKSTELQSQDGDYFEISRDTPHVEIHRGGGSGSPVIAQPIIRLSQEVEVGTGRTPSNSEPTQNGNGRTRSFPKSLKRANCAEESHGEQKRRRKETSTSPVRARSCPKTVMDVVRSRSRSLSHSLVDDECNILSIIMRAGRLSWMRFVLNGQISTQLNFHLGVGFTRCGSSRSG